MSDTPHRIVMTAEEARTCIAKIHRYADDIRQRVLELYSRDGWKALGYESWKDCVQSEFHESTNYVLRQLRCAVIESEIRQEDGQDVPIGTKPQIPESQLRPLSRLPSPQSRKEAWKEAEKAAPQGKLTAKHVEAVVDRKLGQSRVNGKLQPDPPDVAKARASGRLAPEIVPEITEPEQQEQEPQSAELDDSKLSPTEWLNTLPARHTLSGRQRDIFDADALAYRALEKPRETFKYHAVRAMSAAKRKGEYARRLSSFLAINHPNRWQVCPSPENGGCSGTGQLPGVGGQCSKCRARGYWIP